MTSRTPEAVYKHPYLPSTNIEAFRLYVNRTFSLSLESFQDIYEWSISDTESFSWAIWRFCGIIHSTPPKCTVEGLSKMWPPPNWFPEARLNYAENILAPGLAMKPDAIAITAVSEEVDQSTELTFRDLEYKVAQWAETLRSLGVGIGDRVASESRPDDTILLFQLRGQVDN